MTAAGLTLVEVEHHYGWTLHELPGGLLEAALRAVADTHWEVYDPAEARLEAGAWQAEHGGTVAARRIAPLTDGRRHHHPGDLWFTSTYRRHFPHGTPARDRLGRRWAHVSLPGYPCAPAHRGKPWRAACSKWACLSDPREMMLDRPHLFLDEGPDFELEGLPPADPAELERALRLWGVTWDLGVLSGLASGARRPRGAADALRVRRTCTGEERLRMLAGRARRLSARLGACPDGSPRELDVELRILLRAAGVAELVEAERVARIAARGGRRP
jgi:hypothetical protein